MTDQAKTEAPARELLPYEKKLAARREALKNYHLYLEECKRRYPGGSLSQ